MGPPTDTNNDSIPLRITMDGPMDVMALLFMAPFICDSVSPISFPAEYELRKKIVACTIINAMAIPQAIHKGNPFAISFTRSLATLISVPS